MSEQNHSGNGHNIKAARDVFIDALPKIASDLAAVANSLGKKLFLNDGIDDKDPQPFNPENKIKHNNIVKFKLIIDNYKSYVGKLTAIYREFDSQGTNKTHIVLENIKLNYLKEKGALLASNPGKDEIIVIRESADSIIEAVESSLSTEIKTSSNLEISSESVSISLQIILIDAFIRCKILEEPPHATT